MNPEKPETLLALNKEIRSLNEKNKMLEREVARLLETNTALIESEEKYRTIFETTGTATIIIEEDRTISMVNNEFVNLSGFASEEIEGKRKWPDFIEDVDIERMKEYHKKRRDASGSVPRNYECRLRNKWRDDKTAMMTVALIQGTKQSVASVQDITERRKAEEALRYSEEKFSKAFRSSPQMIMISTLEDGRVLDVNDTLLEITGYDKKMIVGISYDAFDMFAQKLDYAGMVAEIKRSGRIRNREVTFRTLSGETRYGNMSAEIIDLQGVRCMLSSIGDITEQRRLENEILRISEAERRKIGYDLHDDLGQHLVGIEALSMLLRKRLNAENHPETHRAEEIADLIRQATSKTRNLAKGLCPVDLDEGGLVSSLFEFSKHIEKIFGISCRFHCGVTLKIREHTLATNLYHIVQEAVNNALRHGKADHVSIFLTAKEDNVVLTVSDNGCGIRYAVKKTGLGMRIMGYRANSIGASLDIRDNTEKGTSVICRINRKLLL